MIIPAWLRPVLKNSPVKPTEISGIVCHEYAALSGCPKQLFFIAGFDQARLATRRHVHATITQSSNQRVSFRVFI